MKTHKTFPFVLTLDEHETLKRRAKAADMTIHNYLKSVAIDGKLPKRK